MRIFIKIIHHTVVYILCAIFLLPLVWLLQASVKDAPQIFKFPPNLIPDPFVWQNYEVLFRKSTNINFFGYTANSLILCGLGILAAVVTNTFIAYGFSRFKFKGREYIFLLVLATMMIPSSLLWIPRYILFKNFGWIGTYLPMLVPAFIGGNALYIFFLRQFLNGISTEYDNAAEIDGCSTFRTLYAILVPMIKPGLVFIVINEFVARWNDFMEPLIYLNKDRTYPLSLGLFQFQNKIRLVVNMFRTGEDPTGAFMALCILTIIPPFILYIFFQKFFMEGVKISGIKG